MQKMTTLPTLCIIGKLDCSLNRLTGQSCSLYGRKSRRSILLELVEIVARKLPSNHSLWGSFLHYLIPESTIFYIEDLGLKTHDVSHLVAIPGTAVTSFCFFPMQTIDVI